MSHQMRPTGSDSSTVDFGCSLSCLDVDGDRGSKTRGIRLRQLKRIDNKPPSRTAFLCAKRLCATYSSIFRGSWQRTVICHILSLLSGSRTFRPAPESRSLPGRRRLRREPGNKNCEKRFRSSEAERRARIILSSCVDCGFSRVLVVG